MAGPDPDLLAQARALDAQAHQFGETTTQGAALRAQAGHPRVRRRRGRASPPCSGGRGARERARVAVWVSRVEPDETGPISPEPGWQIEAARRDEVEAVDASGMVVRFWTVTQRYDGNAWVELEGTRIGGADLDVPSEQSAALPTEQLVEAWLDYKAAVQAWNAAVWNGESARREAARLAQIAHDDAVWEQRAAVDLLDEG